MLLAVFPTGSSTEEQRVNKFLRAALFVLDLCIIWLKDIVSPIGRLQGD